MLSVIVDDTRDPAWNLALDEALLRACEPAVRSPEAGLPGGRAWAPRPARPAPAPMLRIWQNAPSVVVGRFQNVSRAVDLAACARDGVRLVRRASGGGAVYLDTGTLVFSMVRRVGDRAAAPGLTRCTDPRSGARPDLDVLVTTAVAGLGLPAAALRDGIIQTARVRTRSAVLTHVAVHVAQVGAFGLSYVVPDRADTTAGEPRTLTGLGLEVSLDAVRAAVLSLIVDVYGIAATRRPDPRERAAQEQLHAVRYGDVTWHLTGAIGRHRRDVSLPIEGASI